MDERFAELLGSVAAVGRINAVPTLLKVLCESTGLRFAAVSRVTERAWTACAVQDDLEVGIKPGDNLPVETTLCLESRMARAAIVIEQASLDPRYRIHHTPQLYKFESYITVPIMLADGFYFGSLCAFDPEPAQIGIPRVMSMVSRFAALIGSELDAELTHEREHLALINERATSDLREQFIAILGHDLRNPLQAVYATAELLQRKLANPAHSELAARIKTHTGRMAALIDDVLDFARARLGGGVGVQLQVVDNVNAGLASVVQEFQEAQPTCEIISNIFVTQPVRCDLGRLQQVTSNLLANALVHGQPTTPIKFSATADREDLVLEVWNAGDPIPSESLGKIFEPFWRHASSSSRNGLGLGLHICSTIVQAHEGRLSVTSSREGGTRFTARLPLKGAGLLANPRPGESHVSFS
jgi:signal transduction histidine kinase